MSQRIRWSDCTLRLLVNGETKDGSFLKLKMFSWKPGFELPETQFFGERTPDVDIKRTLHEFEIEIENEDSKAWDLMELIDQAEENGLLHPSVAFMVTRAYRDPTTPARTLTMRGVFLKPDGDSGSAGDHVVTKFTGKFKHARYR